MALSVAASSAFGNAFAGSNPQTGDLTFGSPIFSNGSVGATIPGNIYSSVNAGQFQGFFDPSSEGDGPGPEADDFLRFFCIDITHLADTGGAASYTRSAGTTLSTTQLSELTRLFDAYYPNKTTGTYYASGADTNFGSFANATDSAAFQLAIWEIFFGDGTDLTKAPFIATSAAVAEADLWLSVVDSETGTPGGWTFYTLTDNAGNGTPYQTYLTVEYSQPLRSTPEPDLLVLFGSAALAAWFAALRRRQT
ncbi:MAG TPA: thioester domain-containing protein [Casimicrobiaceae bacterium]|nr:thioester domain-containing protein [Casimicrobiaceae bacterium]